MVPFRVPTLQHVLQWLALLFDAHITSFHKQAGSVEVHTSCACSADMPACYWTLCMLYSAASILLLGTSVQQGHYASGNHTPMMALHVLPVDVSALMIPACTVRCLYSHYMLQSIPGHDRPCCTWIHLSVFRMSSLVCNSVVFCRDGWSCSGRAESFCMLALPACVML